MYPTNQLSILCIVYHPPNTQEKNQTKGTLIEETIKPKFKRRLPSLSSPFRFVIDIMIPQGCTYIPLGLCIYDVVVKSLP